MATVLKNVLDWYAFGAMKISTVSRSVQEMWERFHTRDVVNLFVLYWIKRIQYMIDEISKVLHVISNPLHYALKYDLERLVRLLLKLRFDPNRAVKRLDVNHPYPLAWANYDNPRIIRMLLEAGADLEASSYLHHNPLLRAVLVRNLETMDLLLEHNMNINHGLETADTALLKAIEIADTELIQWLKERGAEDKGVQNFNTPLHLAIKSKNLDIVKLFLRDEFNEYFHWLDRSGNTPLLYMSWITDVEMVEKLFSRAIGKLNRRNAEGYTMLHRAVEAKNVYQVKWLVKNGANINVQTFISKETPLHLACKSQPIDLEITKFLIFNRADCNIMNDSWYTPFQLAIQAASSEIVRDMFQHGADGHSWFREMSWTIAVCNMSSPETVLILEMLECMWGFPEEDYVYSNLLTKSIRGGSDDIVEYMLRRFAYKRNWIKGVEEGYLMGQFIYCSNKKIEVQSTKKFKAQAILRYAAIAEYQKVNILGITLILERNPDFKKYYARCKEELYEMQLTKFSVRKRNLNLLEVVLNILLNGDIAAPTYAANQPLTRALFKLSHKFPIYFKSLTNAYQRERQIQDLRLRASKFISKTFGFNCYKHLVVEKITNYLTPYDLVAYKYVGDD